MDTNSEFNIQQRAAIDLIQCDLRFLYTIVANRKNVHSNYTVMAMPYMGTIVDGVEDWIKAFNNSHQSKIDAPLFTAPEQKYYEEMRSSIKQWDAPYPSVYLQLKNLYMDSDRYFSNLCKPFARKLHFYDIFSADIVDGQYCGNTILCSYFIPEYTYDSSVLAIGKRIKLLSEIGGRYVSIFGATSAYKVDRAMTFSYTDYGGFIKSPVGNVFSDKFVLFSLLCEVNFVLLCIEKYILEECPTKLRFEYLQYYYLSKIFPEINKELHTHFSINTRWVSEGFRNAMAHYKIGVALKATEIIPNDYLHGLTQKFLQTDYFTLKDSVLRELSSISEQLTHYLNLK